MMIHREDRFTGGGAHRENPFTVPDGYFSSFTSRMMEQLPEHEPVELKPRTARPHILLRRILYAAACLCVAVSGVAVYWTESGRQQADTAHPRQAVQAAASDSYVEQVADYTMMDNSDIYTYLSSNDQ